MGFDPCVKNSIAKSVQAVSLSLGPNLEFILLVCDLQILKHQIKKNLEYAVELLVIFLHLNKKYQKISIISASTNNLIGLLLKYILLYEIIRLVKCSALLFLT